MRTMTTILALMAVAALAAPAAGDWDPGGPCKMHFPQLPDPEGWDVNFVEPKVLADDWRCTETGPVSDIHFWMSSRYDEPFDIVNIHASIHTDDLSNPAFSQPGDLLWEYDFDPSLFTVRDWHEQGPQGWLNPNDGTVEPLNHFLIFQVNIPRIPDPFIQLEGEIYWLDLSVFAVGPDGILPAEVGWKTSIEQYRDDAVWSDFLDPGDPDGANGGTVDGWQPLIDPFTGESLDLAFVITPEPATLALLGLGGALVMLRRRQSKG